MTMKIMMLKYFLLLLISISYLSCNQKAVEPDQQEPSKLKALLFSKTAGYRHESIEPGSLAMKEFFSPRSVELTHTEDSSVFNGNALSIYDVVIFFNTTGNILDSIQQQALINHVKSGKGFVGI